MAKCFLWISLALIHQQIDGVARKHGLDPALVRAIVEVESNYNPYARSHKGAIGLMQLMPETAKAMGVDKPYHIKDNLEGGCKYLKYLLNKYHGNLSLALAAYNAGPTVVDAHGGIPPYPETQRYVRKVMRRYKGRNTLRVYRNKKNQLVIANIEVPR